MRGLQIILCRPKINIRQKDKVRSVLLPRVWFARFNQSAGFLLFGLPGTATLACDTINISELKVDKWSLHQRHRCKPKSQECPDPAPR